MAGEAATGAGLELIAAYKAAKAAVRQWHVANGRPAKEAGPAAAPFKRKKTVEEPGAAPSGHVPVAARSNKGRIAIGKQTRSYGGPDIEPVMTAAALGVTSADRRTAKKAAKRAASAGARPIDSFGQGRRRGSY